MRKLIISALILLAASTAFAQDKKGNILSVVSSDSLNIFLREYMEQTSGKRFEDPTVPRFLICDRKDMFVFGVGGYVGAKLIYDYQGNSKAGFQPVDPSTTSHSNDVLGIDMTSSRFFFKVLGNTKKGIIEAYLESGFSGDNKTLKLLKAYVSLFGFRVGLSRTAFSDTQTVPTISDGTLYSFSDRNVPMIAYSYLFNNGIRVQGGFEFPQATSIYTSIEPGGPMQVVTVGMPQPDITVVSYFDRGNLHLFAGGYLRFMQYYDESNTRRFRNKTGYAFQLSGNYRFQTGEISHKLFLQTQYEHMMADCFDNLNNKGLSVIMPYRIGWTSYDTTNGIGGQAGYQLAFGQNTFNLQCGTNRLFGHEKSGYPELYKQGYVTTLNYMRKFFKYGTLGAEVVYGRSYTVGGSVLKDFRTVVLLRYDF